MDRTGFQWYSVRGRRVVIVSLAAVAVCVAMVRSEESAAVQAVDASTATWSPDSRQLVFQSTRSGGPELWIGEIATRAVRRLTSGDAAPIMPAWSRDGARLVFQSTRDGNHEIYVMTATGASPVRLTDNSSGDFQPSWAPSGEWIAFTSDRLGRLQIYLIRPDGSGEQHLDL